MKRSTIKCDLELSREQKYLLGESFIKTSSDSCGLGNASRANSESPYGSSLFGGSVSSRNFLSTAEHCTESDDNLAKKQTVNFAQHGIVT